MTHSCNTIVSLYIYIRYIYIYIIYDIYIRYIYIYMTLKSHHVVCPFGHAPHRLTMCHKPISLRWLLRRLWCRLGCPRREGPLARGACRVRRDLEGSRERPLLQSHCGRLVLGYVGVTSSCTVRVWGCLRSPVGRGSGRAHVCPRMSMGCCRVPAWGGLFAMPRS
jgi:hypothetical protein